MANDLVPDALRTNNAPTRSRGGTVAGLSIGAGVGAVGLAMMLFSHHPPWGLLLAIVGFGSIAAQQAFVALGAYGARNPAPAVDDLRRALGRCQYVDGCEARGEKASEQLRQVEERFRGFEKLLSSKLDPSELTFSRYLGAAAQVRLAIRDRLRELAELVSSLAQVQPSELEPRLRELEKGPPADASTAEAVTLRERLALLKTQLGKADRLLALNEQGLTELDRANAALTEMKTTAGQATLDLETAMKRLEELAKRASLYSS